MWCVYTVEYYTAIKKNEVLPFASTWMDLEGIMLSEISQPGKDKYCIVSLICEIKTHTHTHTHAQQQTQTKWLRR